MNAVNLLAPLWSAANEHIVQVYCYDCKNSWYTYMFFCYDSCSHLLNRSAKSDTAQIYCNLGICCNLCNCCNFWQKCEHALCIFIWNYFLINFKGTFVYVLENGLFLFFRKSSQIRSCYEKYKKQIVLWWFMVTKSKLPVQQFKLRVRHARDSTKNNSIDRKQWNTQYYSTFFYDVSVICIVCKK